MSTKTAIIDMDDDNIWDVFDELSSEEKPIKKDTSICSSCGSNDLVNDSSKGYLVCRNCGVFDSIGFDNGLEKTSYDDDKEVSRCAGPTNFFLPKSSIGTTIGGVGNNRIKMLQKWSQMPYKERSLYEVIQKIESRCKKYNIPKSVIDNAKILYKNISETKYDDSNKTIIIRGINRESLIAACVYYGARMQKFPRTVKEVSDIFELKITQVTKGCRKFLDIMENNPIISNMISTNAVDFIERYAGKLKIKRNFIEQAIQISNNINKLELISDHQPPSIAAGSIMIMSVINNLNLNKKMISEVFNISEVTISKTYNRIIKYKDILINDELVEKALSIMNKN